MDLENALKALRKTHEGEDALKVYDAFRSHAAIPRKNRLMLTLLDDIRQANAEVIMIDVVRWKLLSPS